MLVEVGNKYTIKCESFTVDGQIDRQRKRKSENHFEPGAA